MNLGSLVYAIQAKNRAFKSKINDSKNTIRDLDNRVDKSRQRMKKWGAAITAASVAVAGATTKMAADLQEQMATVHTLLGPESEARINELKENVKDLAIGTGKDFQDLTGGLYQVVSAFGDGADTARILEINAKAAAAGIATTTDAINLTSAVTKAYGDTSAEAVEHTADLAFQAVVLGQTTFPELAGAIGATTPLASALNVSVQELFGSFATLTGVTGSANEVSTQLRATLQGLLRPSTELRSVMNQLGYETGEQMIQAHGLQGTLELLYEATGRNNEALGEMFGSVRALTGVLPLINDLSDDYTRKTQAMHDATGSMNDAFEIQQQTVNAMISRIRQIVNVALVDIGERYLPLVERLLQTILDLPEPVREFATAAGILGTSLGLIVGPLALIVGYLPRIKEGLLAIKASAAFLGPKAWLVMGVVALAAAIFGVRREVHALTQDLQALSLEEAEIELKRVTGELEEIERRIQEMEEERDRRRDETVAPYGLGIGESLPPELREAYQERAQLLEEEEVLVDHLKALRDRARAMEIDFGAWELPEIDIIIPDSDEFEVELNEFEKAMRDLRHRIAMGELELHEQINELRNIRNMQWVDGYELTTEEIMQLDEEISRKREQLAVNEYNAAIKHQERLLQHRETSVEDVIATYQRLNRSIEADEDLSVERRIKIAERLQDRILQLEYQKQIDIQAINRQVTDRMIEVGDIQVDARIMQLMREEEALIDSYHQQLGNTKEFEEKRAEIEALYARLRLQKMERIDDERMKDREQFEQRWNERLFRLTASRLEQIEEEERKALEEAKRLKADEQAVREYYAHRRMEVERDTVREEMQYRIQVWKELELEEEARITSTIDSLESLKIMYQDNALAVDMIKEAIKELQKEFDDLKDSDPVNWLANAFVHLKDDIEWANNQANRFVDSLERGLARAIVRGESLADTLRRIADQLAEMIIHEGIIKPMMGMVFPALPTAHEGALVTTSGLIQDLSEAHQGMLIEPDERIIKAQVGERILSKEDNKAFERGEFGKREIINLFQIDATDVQSFARHIEENRDVVENIIGHSIMDNSFLREIIIQYGSR